MPDYPYQDGDVTVIGPEAFATLDCEVLCWQGVNYERQHSWFSEAELEEIAEWANAFMGDAPEAFDDGSPGRSAYEKVQARLGVLADGD